MKKEQTYKYWESWDTGKERMQQVIKIKDLPPEQQGPSSKRLVAFDAPMAEPSLRFNDIENKSPEHTSDTAEEDEDIAYIIPVSCGGKLDPIGGMAARMKDLRKFEALLKKMKNPVVITLTVDRSRFDGPEDAYNACMKKISKLLTEKLRLSIWGRVIEPQTQSGDGYIHWHIVADVTDTEFEKKRWIRDRYWVDLKALQGRVKYYWCERWKLGQPQGQDIQQVKSRTGMAGYLSKYITKPWPAIPQWILKRTCMRLVGFSKAVNCLLNIPLRNKKKSQVRKTKRPIGLLIDRIPTSQTRCNVISKDGYLGVLNARCCDLYDMVGSWGLRAMTRKFVNTHTVVLIKCVVMEMPNRKMIERINKDFVNCGYSDMIRNEVLMRKEKLLNSWSKFCN